MPRVRVTASLRRSFSRALESKKQNFGGGQVRVCNQAKAAVRARLLLGPGRDQQIRTVTARLACSISGSRSTLGLSSCNLSRVEHLSLERTEQGFRLVGFPDAERLVRLDPGDEKAMADLHLHRVDLDRTQRCLECLFEGPVEELVAEALWTTALVGFFKCFMHSASREKLVFEDVYAGQEDIVRVVFDYLKALRNKHVVHDENAWNDALPGAVVNKEGVEPKIAQVVCTTIVGSHMEDGNLSNLKKLNELALAYTEARVDELGDQITARLEQLTHAELLAREEPPSYRVATADDISKKRSARPPGNPATLL